MTDDQLQFIDYRKPKLEAGYYQFNAQHEIIAPQGDEHLVAKDNLKLCVTGERLSINPKDIFAQYPPPNESGDYADTIPHISFTKGSLPWIRSAYDKDDELKQKGDYELYEPWLYLLATNQNDVEQGLVRFNEPMRLEELDEGAYFPAVQKQSLLDDISLPESSKTVQTIDIKKSLFKKLLLNGKNDSSDKDQLEYLAHVRRRWQPDGSEFTLSTLTPAQLNDPADGDLSELKLPRDAKLSTVSKDRGWLAESSLKGNTLIDRVPTDGDDFIVQKLKQKRELSVLVANRFGQNSVNVDVAEPQENQASVVSLENYLTEEVIEDILNLKERQFVRLIILTSWRYYCASGAVNFEERVKALDVDAFKLPPKESDELSGDLIDRLKAGLIALPHYFRQGARSISWYRGPLSPCPVGDADQVQLTDRERSYLDNAYAATDADKLLCFHQKEGMLDVSYSAAYELGRFLSLKNPDFLSALSQYKTLMSRRICLEHSDLARQQAAASRGVHIATLPYAKRDNAVLKLHKDTIEQWLLSLGDFSQLPNWYLIPDPELLPKRSLRTFYIDPKWIQCLWLGALSLDGRPETTYHLFSECHKALNGKLPKYGMILRSDVVWAYPELVVEMRNIGEATIAEKVDLEVLKDKQNDEYTDFIEQKCPLSKINFSRKLANDTQLMTTDDPFDYVSLALPPESLHYGADFDANANANKVMYTKGIKFRGKTVETVDVPMTDKELAIIDTTALAKSIIEKLQTGLKEDDTAKDFVASLSDFKSARFSRFMLEGEPKVEFTVGDQGEE